MTIEQRTEANERQIEALMAVAADHDHRIDTIIGVLDKAGQAIAGLATAAERHAAAIEANERQIEALTRQWQSYINTLPRQ